VAGRPGAGRWRLLAPRLRPEFPDTVRGQTEVLELSYADYLGHLRAERDSCPPLGQPKPPLERPADRTG